MIYIGYILLYVAWVLVIFSMGIGIFEMIRSLWDDKKGFEESFHAGTNKFLGWFFYSFLVAGLGIAWITFTIWLS